MRTLHALGCTRPQLVGASAMSQGVLGLVGTTIGIPLGIGFYLLFKAASGGGVEGFPPPAAVVVVALAAIAATMITAAVPALVVQRRPINQALAAE
ncbi:MAG: FtsX-like permease family protein [Acidimicrobiales bacterium]